MYKELESERLLIRPIALTDSDFILALVNSEGWLKFIGDREIGNTSHAENYIQKILDNERFFYSVFEIKQTKEPIGIVSFLYRDEQDSPDIGFAMLPGFEKKGYAFEASKKYLEEVLAQKLATTIIALTDPENFNSIKLLQKLGLRFKTHLKAADKTIALYVLLAD